MNTLIPRQEAAGSARFQAAKRESQACANLKGAQGVVLTMGHQNLKSRLFRLVASSAVSLVIGLLGREITKAIRRGRASKRADRKLDTALQDSMDCSDPVAQY